MLNVKVASEPGFRGDVDKFTRVIPQTVLSWGSAEPKLNEPKLIRAHDFARH